VPGAIARAYHEACAGRGPALVVVPMGDWEEDADALAAGSPSSVVRAAAVDGDGLRSLASMIDAASSVALVVGAGADSREGWDAVVALAERLRCPVWQEAFGSRAGFPQDHELFAGHLPWMRARMGEKLSGFDLVVAVGTSAFRAYLFDEAVPLVGAATRVGVITEDVAEAHRSRCEIAVVAPVASACAALAEMVDARSGGAVSRERPPSLPVAHGELVAGHVLAALGARLPADAVLVEETPSSRPELLERIPARAPLGFISNANGGLGFGLAGAIGLRMGLPDRPVVAVVGDGSAMYAIQSLWSAARYRVGVLLVVLANGGYAIMDELARARGGEGPWPGFGGIDIAGVARCLGCPAVSVRRHDELTRTFDDVLPGLRDRREPLLVEVSVAS
jgi:benzoylformate decarboxylase